jgi:hypothetical protein
MIFLCWAMLFFLLLKRDVFIDPLDLKELQTLRQAESEEFQSIYFREQKIGYVSTTYRAGPAGGQLLEQEAKMRLNVAQTEQTITLHLKATLSTTNYLRDFEFSFQSPFYQMQAKGTVEGTALTYQLATGTNVISDTLTFSAPPLLATSRRPYLLHDGMNAGEKRRLPWFDPVSLADQERVLEYHGRESVLINGRVQKLHRFSESFSGARINSWLNDAGLVVKEESPAGFVFLKEPKFKALGHLDEGEELLGAVAVKLHGSVGDIAGTTMRYRLQIPDDTQFDLNGGRQHFQDQLLTVTREELPTGTAAPTCDAAAPALAASPYIQADHPEIKKLAEQIIAGTTEPVERVQRLAAWVHDNLEKRPVLGLPDALTTLAARQGDCNEHAALFAALARAAAIPTRIAAGVTLHREDFYYHAWNEVCLTDRWITIDTTTRQFPADLTHLRFVVGEMREQLRLGSLLGTLAIEPLPSRDN